MLRASNVFKKACKALESSVSDSGRVDVPMSSKWQDLHADLYYAV